MKKIVIYSADRVLVKKYYQNKDVIFLDSHGWHVLDKKDQRSIYPVGFTNDLHRTNLDVEEIRSEILKWSTVWERWVSNKESESLIKSVSTLTILNIAADFKSLNIDIIICQTGVPHHYDSSLIHIAAKMLSIQQIYLYWGVIDGRLITLDMSSDLKTRRHTNLSVSAYDSSSSIDDFISNRRQGNQPKTSVKQALWKRSFSISVIAILYFHGRNMIQRLCTYKNNENWWNDYTPIGCIQDISISLRQRAYLKLYKKSVKKVHKENAIKFIITAHYQPEATSYPEGGECPDHVEIALSLRSKGYKDKILYKEHPATNFYVDDVIGSTRVGLHRSRKYYNTLKKIGCIFISDNTDLSLNKGECEWYIPITISGTIAIERSLAGLHTIISGEPVFKDLPGLIRLSDISSIANIKKSWSIPDSELATSARTALENMLSTKTILNYPGVGSGLKLSEHYQKDIFLKEFDSLIQGLLKK